MIKQGRYFDRSSDVQDGEDIDLIDMLNKMESSMNFDLKKLTNSINFQAGNKPSKSNELNNNNGKLKNRNNIAPSSVKASNNSSLASEYVPTAAPLSKYLEKLGNDDIYIDEESGEPTDRFLEALKATDPYFRQQFDATISDKNRVGVSTDFADVATSYSKSKIGSYLSDNGGNKEVFHSLDDNLDRSQHVIVGASENNGYNLSAMSLSTNKMTAQEPSVEGPTLRMKSKITRKNYRKEKKMKPKLTNKNSTKNSQSNIIEHKTNKKSKIDVVIEDNENESHGDNDEYCYNDSDDQDHYHYNFDHDDDADCVEDIHQMENIRNSLDIDLNRSVEHEKKEKTLKLRLAGQLQTIKALESKVAETNLQLEEKTTQISQLQSKIRSVQSTKDHQYQQINRSSKAEINRSMSIGKDTVMSMKEECLSWTNKFEAEQARRMRAEERVKQLKSYSDKFKERCNELENNNENLQDERDELLNRLRKMKRVYKATASDDVMLKVQIQEYEKSIDSERMRNKTLENIVKNMQTDLDNYKTLLHNQKVETQKATSIIKQLRQQLGLQHEMEAAKRAEVRLVTEQNVSIEKPRSSSSSHILPQRHTEAYSHDSSTSELQELIRRNKEKDAAFFQKFHDNQTKRNTRDRDNNKGMRSENSSCEGNDGKKIPNQQDRNKTNAIHYYIDDDKPLFTKSSANTITGSDNVRSRARKQGVTSVKEHIAPYDNDEEDYRRSDDNNSSKNKEMVKSKIQATKEMRDDSHGVSVGSTDRNSFNKINSNGVSSNSSSSSSNKSSISVKQRSLQQLERDSDDRSIYSDRQIKYDRLQQLYEKVTTKIH